MTTLDPTVLELDCPEATQTIQRAIVRIVSRKLNRRGVVVGVSGGVDSAVCAALATGALGAGRVFALITPEAESSQGGTDRARRLCERLGIQYAIEDIGGALTALGCYQRRDEAIFSLFPSYRAGYRNKITLAEGLLDRDRVSYFNLVVEEPSGDLRSERMPPDVYSQVVAATNMKQRTRKLIEYFHAERLNYAVLGTPNRLELELGFFVRGGDGLADLKPIAHLYKSQVYALADHLGIPGEIRNQLPSTDTYSLEQSQEEFYFGLPFRQMDILLYSYHHEIAQDEAARALGLSAKQVGRVYRDIDLKRRVAARGLRDAYVVEKVAFTDEHE